MKLHSYKRYLLGVLLVVTVFNNVDRYALGVALQSIKTEFGLTDSELGLLTGLAFALFYSTMGIPIARWADRHDRVKLIAIATGLWCAAVALCAAAGNFLQLLLIRVGVAVGEAGALPTAQSLIADFFDRSERPRAVSTFMLGGPLSMLLGYFFAGWLNDFYGWRWTFVIVGLPGVGLALLVYFTLLEPRRKAWRRRQGRLTGRVAGMTRVPALREVAVMLWRNQTFRHLALYYSVVSFFSYGITQWKPTFFIRTYGLSTGEVGTWLALTYGTAGLIGLHWGGQWASKFAPRNETRQLRVMAGVTAIFGLVSVFIYLSPSYSCAFILMALATIANAATVGPLFATVQNIIPDNTRATSFAVIYLFANLIGMGLGPFAAGILSDTLQPIVDGRSLQYALVVFSPGYLWAAWHLWRASTTVKMDLDACQSATACQEHAAERVPCTH